MLRAIITALIEYVLAIIAFRKGKLYPNLFALILFLLASYQLGEAVLFLTNGNQIGIQIAYFSTTLLPPLGVLLVEKLTGRKYGYPIFQIVGGAFALMYLLLPSVLNYEVASCCIKITGHNSIWPRIWGYYYSGTLSYTIAIIIVNCIKTKLAPLKRTMLWLITAYSSFYFVSLAIIFIFPDRRQSLASVMCALGVIAGFIFVKISLEAPKKKAL